jgi:hypothetical protein
MSRAGLIRLPSITWVCLPQLGLLAVAWWPLEPKECRPQLALDKHLPGEYSVGEGLCLLITQSIQLRANGVPERGRSFLIHPEVWP